MSVPGGQTMSTSIDIRLELFRCSIRDVPPLNLNGHPDLARASNSENARIVFSTRVICVAPFFLAASLIHFRVLLSAEIIFFYVFDDAFDFVAAVSSASVAEKGGGIYLVLRQGRVVDVVGL